MQNKLRAPLQEPFVRRHRPFFVALFVAVPLVVMPILIFFTLIKSDTFQPWCTLHVVYPNSQGLKKGSQVSMSGITIGHVKDVDLIREGEIYVTFDINSRYTRLLRKDTKARLKQRGFVGDWEIELTGGTPDSPWAEDGDTLKAERPPSIDDMIELASGVIDTAIHLLTDIAAIVKGLEAGQGTAGQILKNDTLFMNINRIAANIVGITSDAKNLTRDVKGTIRNVDTLLSTVTTVTSDVAKTGTAFVDSLMMMIGTVNKSIDDVGHILKNVKTISDDAPELMDRLQHDLGEIEIMLRSFQEGWLFRNIGGGNPPRNPHLADTP